MDEGPIEVPIGVLPDDDSRYDWLPEEAGAAAIAQIRAAARSLAEGLSRVSAGETRRHDLRLAQALAHNILDLLDSPDDR